MLAVAAAEVVVVVIPEILGGAGLRALVTPLYLTLRSVIRRNLAARWGRFLVMSSWVWLSVPGTNPAAAAAGLDLGGMSAHFCKLFALQVIQKQSEKSWKVS